MSVPPAKLPALRSLLTILSCLSFLGLETFAEKKSASADDRKALEAFGASMGSNLSRHFELSDAELDIFVEGFLKGYKGEISEEELRKSRERVQAYLEPKREAAKAREQERMKAELAKVRMPMDMEIETSAGAKTSLAKLVEGKHGVLLDFWASWCGPCMRLMPELKKKAEKYEGLGIVVAGMNTENASKAEKVRKEREIGFSWLVEPSGRPLSKMLKINSIPRMILLDPEGKVLFNGHPMDDELTAALDGLSSK